ncbi:recombination-associated protein RdgC [Nitrosomonas ureae]|uniref:Recombination-associated protein RdgC n=1 Tax=Nitrosomonas ureae TaxID=44577 RepID=A0A1H2F1D9_9PROT|nr:recombination-associated protein RdgC [Nitrosomonas ureae]ALQ51754.1 recombination-associated protein RdgC [Nitrosomonas ureae]SDU01135.1 recombination associated protein RdgC [Nitrosomonas ureae]
MWFRNLQAYRITSGNITLNNLEEALSNHALQPCLQTEMQSRGWMTPREEQQNFVHAYGQQWLIALGVEKKLLPAGVINQQAKDSLAKMEQMQGYKPGKKQIRDIKEATIIELMPRAFTQRHKTYAWIDAIKNRLIIDTASTQKADELVEVLVKSMHGLTLAPLETQTSPSSAMTRWLSGTDLPSIFSIDRDCELQGMNDEKATVKYTHHVLEAEETARHVRAGKKVIKLAMTWDSKISFVLHDNLQLRRIAPQDILKESTEDVEELFVSDFAIMTGELSQLITEMVDALGGEDLS